MMIKRMLGWFRRHPDWVSDLDRMADPTPSRLYDRAAP